MTNCWQQQFMVPSLNGDRRLFVPDPWDHPSAQETRLAFPRFAICFLKTPPPQQSTLRRVDGRGLSPPAPASRRLYFPTLSVRSQAELPRWVGDTAEAPRLVEAEPGICEGLVQFCLAEAQQMAIGKVRESSSPECVRFSSVALLRFSDRR